ncbi:MAG: 3-deoxy-manno-octulosonate cytidylyltransferase [Bacteroidia bacterium]|nr:3-deoxy-manno-octulosonate cytidylyltransferase [Bacteroidia bacterium]
MILGVIPARYASTRFPGKPLVDIGGKSMIRRVYEQACLARHLDRVVVATDDDRIWSHVRAFGGEAVMTAETHLSGTERAAEVAAGFPDYPFVLNIQGDEPFLDPAQLDLLCDTLVTGTAPVATLIGPLEDSARIQSPHVVKVVCNARGEALYFSRSPIPFVRDLTPETWGRSGLYFRHIGLYGFRREALLTVNQLTPSPLEQAESLEQLRWLAAGWCIQTAISHHHSPAVDTPEDLRQLPGYEPGTPLNFYL